MIEVKKAERYTSCVCCASGDNVTEIRLQSGNQSFVFGLCRECLAELISKLPIADFEQRSQWVPGEIIAHEYLSPTSVRVVVEDWHCGKCGEVIKQHEEPYYNFCPHCGVHMHGWKNVPILKNDEGRHE